MHQKCEKTGIFSDFTNVRVRYTTARANNTTVRNNYTAVNDNNTMARSDYTTVSCHFMTERCDYTSVNGHYTAVRANYMSVSGDYTTVGGNYTCASSRYTTARTVKMAAETNLSRNAHYFVLQSFARSNARVQPVRSCVRIPDFILGVNRWFTLAAISFWLFQNPTASPAR